MKTGRVPNPKAIATLYSYRQGAARSLSANLLALGLDKPPPLVQTLDEILSEDVKTEGSEDDV